MNKQSEPISIIIDNRPLQVDSGITILQAAQNHSIYIPTLCAHKDLTPFGGCRICIVEVDGMRGFPTACTTPVQEGMIVRTQTTQVNAIRAEILQLILSEHPVSCLICDESEECKLYNITTRKVGVTTGCRYCPNDGQCELHEVVDKIGIKEIGYPILYRNLRVEKEDPFFDRDYNLCILCGRCVRMCQEIRTAGTLAFKQRGHQTIIGPAYDRTHLEAGCEFCGACVSVCPTGALSEKTRKWEGKADREEVTTCAFCGIGCQIRLQIKGNEIIGSLPKDDPLVNNGQLCVKGRFCVTETVNDHRRLKRPYKTIGMTNVDIPFSEAIEIAAGKLSKCPPEEFGMVISPNCTNEDLYIAQKFTRTVMRSNNIDASARIFYGPAFNSYLHLFSRSVPLSILRKASAILAVGLDTRFARSVAGVELRIATRRGAKLITINSYEHNLSLIADKKIYPHPERILATIDTLIGLTANVRRGVPSDGDLAEVASLLLEDESPAVLIGPGIFSLANCSDVLDSILELAKNINAGILPLPTHNNFIGSILMGAYGELLPGGQPCKENKSQWNSLSNDPGLKRKVLYLIGEVPCESWPTSDFLVYQNIFHPPPSPRPNLFLPSAAFSEINGSFINGEGRIQQVRKGVSPPGEARANWEIICEIAKKMGADGFNFASADEIRLEIADYVKGFEDGDYGKRTAATISIDVRMDIPQEKSPSASDDQSLFKLDISIIEHSYLGFPLANWVSGLKSLYADGMININPQDAKKIGLLDGDIAVLKSCEVERKCPIRIQNKQPQGRISMTIPMNEKSGFDYSQVSIRKSDV